MKKLLAGAAALTGLILGGCSQDAQANEVEAIRIGLMVDEANPQSGIANEAFRQALEEHIGIPVIETEGLTHLVGIEAMRGGHLDIMFTSPFTFLNAQEVVDVEFLAMMDNPDSPAGSPTIITAADRDDINSLEDFRGKSFAFVDTTSLTGFLLPKYLFVTTFGLNPDLFMHQGEFFSNSILAGGHDATLLAAVNGDVDGAVAVSTAIENIVNAGVISDDDFKVIYTMERSPVPGYMIRSELGGELIASIREFFLAYADEDYFEVAFGSPNARFAAPDYSAIDHLRSLMQTLNME
ncbi:MAG: phosphate/phosphite/phosphonate ABC transporter substrate-binding protein [Turicibacter sp.]|nr:phosphate/phosphite/phosphonate ABC transporter substrate-binding protein [Turicibacter sp.]